MRPLAVALIHYPVLARDQSRVTTSITNLDIHDVARSAFTYGALRYYLVHPLQAQQHLAKRVIEHWTAGSGALRIPDRKPPMEMVRVVSTCEQASQDLGECCAGQQPELWVTSAKPLVGAVAHAEARERLEGAGPPVLLVLGTGWGLAPELLGPPAVPLAPLVSPRQDGYNHLSVRAAAAILLDRLLAPRQSM